MPAYSIKRLLWVGPLSTLAALAADLLYFFITRALGEPYLLPFEGNALIFFPMSALTPVPVVLVSGIAATLLFILLIRFARRPDIVFLSVAITALILSFGGSFGLPSTPLQTKLFLSGMNVITGVIITAGILLYGRKIPATPGT